MKFSDFINQLNKGENRSRNILQTDVYFYLRETLPNPVFFFNFLTQSITLVAQLKFFYDISLFKKTKFEIRQKTNDSF